MSNNVCAGSPSLSARTNASHTPIMEMPRIRLLQILAACPLPGAPAWITALPILSRIGRAAAKAFSLPPTIKVSVAASAPATPPDTGASRASKPALAAAAWTTRAVSTSMVEQTMSSVPGPARPMMPSAPRYTPRTCWPAGSMVMTMSAPPIAAPRSAAAAAPAATALSTAGPAVSKARTSWPAASRLRAIGRPMFPNPIKPILAMSRPHRLGLREFEVRLACRLEIAPDHRVRNLCQRRRPPARRLVLVDQRRPHTFVEIRRRRHLQGHAELHAHGRREIVQARSEAQLAQGHLQARRRLALQHDDRLVRPHRLLGRQPRQDFLDRLAREAAIDRRALMRQRRGARIARHAIEQSGDDVAMITLPDRPCQLLR